MNKREQIKKWFNLGDLSMYWIFGVIGGLGAFIMLGALFSGGNITPILLMTVIFLTPVFLLFNKYKQKEKLPSESQLDAWLEEDIQKIIKKRPYNKLGIAKEDLVAESMLVVGPIYWNVNGFDVNDILMKTGKDGFNRYTTWTIQLFMFTENYLCSYKCNYNWLKNTYINESTNEFFYKDVVSVKTDTVSSAHTLMDGQQLVQSEAFQLKLMGDEVTVITNDVSLKTSTAMTSKAEKAVQSIRVMLREKKS